MSPSPDFAAMLSAITDQADQADLTVTVKQATASVAVTCTGSIHVVLASHAPGGKARTDISIAGAVTDACIGMADRRLMRGDTEGAADWIEIAAEHD